MKRLWLITEILALAFVGGCVESTFHLSQWSALPHGLRADEAAQRAARTASRIELWLYTYDPPKLKFYAGPDLVLSRTGSSYRNLDRGFSVRFNDVDSLFRHVAYPNVIAVEEHAEGASQWGS